MDISIFKRDNQIKNLETQLQFLKNKKQKHMYELKQNQNENELLQNVIEDYKKHYKTILSLKHQQRENIENLIDYIEREMVEAGITDTMLEYSRQEKKQLMKELDTIKKEIDIISSDIEDNE